MFWQNAQIIISLLKMWPIVSKLELEWLNLDKPNSLIISGFYWWYIRDYNMVVLQVHFNLFKQNRKFVNFQIYVLVVTICSSLASYCTSGWHSVVIHQRDAILTEQSNCGRGGKLKLDIEYDMAHQRFCQKANLTKFYIVSKLKSVLKVSLVLVCGVLPL